MVALLATPSAAAGRLFVDFQERLATALAQKQQREARDARQRECAATREQIPALAVAANLSESDLATLRRGASCGPIDATTRELLIQAWTARTSRLATPAELSTEDLKNASEALAEAVELGGSSTELVEAASTIQLELVNQLVDEGRKAQREKRYADAALLFEACGQPPPPLVPEEVVAELSMSADDCVAAASYSRAWLALGEAPDVAAYKAAVTELTLAVESNYRDAARLKTRWTDRAEKAERDAERAFDRLYRRAEASCLPQHRECPAAQIQEKLLVGELAQVRAAREEAQERFDRARARWDSSTVRDHLKEQLEQLEEREETLRDKLNETTELMGYHCREQRACVSAFLRANE